MLYRLCVLKSGLQKNRYVFFVIIYKYTMSFFFGIFHFILNKKDEMYVHVFFIYGNYIGIKKVKHLLSQTPTYYSI